MTPRIQKAIDIFLDAINEGTLAKGTCLACACGNLVANGLGIKPVIHKTHTSYLHYLGYVHRGSYTSKEGAAWSLTVRNDSRSTDQGKREVEMTGFTSDELRRIEKAFEGNTRINFTDYCFYSKEEIREDQIKGLKAVIEVMLKFDNQSDDVKEVFIDKAELIPIPA